jgi:hypothetical protein
VRHGGPEHVDSVMVDGAWVLRGGRILVFDEAAAIADARDQAEAVRARVADRLPILLAAMPEVAGRFKALCE